MTRETITKRQAVCLVTMYLLGTVVVMNLSPEAEQDTWASLLMAAAGFIPLLLVYARIIKLCPEKDLFQIIEALFGKVVAKVLILLMLWYSIHLFSLVIRNISEFVKIVAMPETPQLPITLIMVLVASFMARSGEETLGKWSVAVLPFVLLFVIITLLLSLNRMDFSNIQPVLSHDVAALGAGAFDMLAFPFGETVLFLGVASAVKKTDSARKIYFSSVALGTLVMLVVLMRNIETLGVPLMKVEYFPSYVAARIINVGDVITRIEGTISINYLLAGFTKGTLCLLFAAKGAASLFGVGDYKKLVMPVGLLALALCAIVYKSTMEMFAFFKIYTYYALPFEIAIPLLVWITAEIMTRKARRIPA